MGDVYEFSPAAATTKSITAAATTSNVNLPVGGPGSSGSRAVRVYNSTGVVVFINFGTSSAVTALVTHIPIPPGAVEFFEVPAVMTYVAGITAAGGGTVYFTEGEGI